MPLRKRLSLERETAAPGALIGAVLHELLLVAAGPFLLVLALAFAWGGGIYRFAVLAVLELFVLLVCFGKAKLASVFALWHARWLPGLGAAVLFFMHVNAFVSDIERGDECTTDMGRPSICAGQWLLQGDNPWSQCLKLKLTKKQRKHPETTLQWCVRDGSCIDPKLGGRYREFGHHGAALDFMDGYKYGPLMVLAYLPATSTLVEQGLYLTNFVFWLGLAVLVALLARRAYPHVPAVSARALVGLMFSVAFSLERMLPTVRILTTHGTKRISMPDRYALLREMTTSCSNDVIPMTLVLAALWLASHKRSASAGVLLGLSMASKPLPGPLLGLLIVCLEGVRWKRFVGGAVLAAAVCYLPFFAWAPAEMFANLVLFNLVRPTNSSSIRNYLPQGIEPLVTLAQLGLLAGCVWWFARRSRRSLAELLPVACVLCVGFVALNKVVHGNYLLWIQPLLALAIAGAPFAEQGAELQRPPARSRSVS